MFLAGLPINLADDGLCCCCSGLLNEPHAAVRRNRWRDYMDMPSTPRLCFQQSKARQAATVARYSRQISTIGTSGCDLIRSSVKWVLWRSPENWWHSTACHPPALSWIICTPLNSQMQHVLAGKSSSSSPPVVSGGRKNNKTSQRSAAGCVTKINVKFRLVAGFSLCFRWMEERWSACLPLYYLPAGTLQYVGGNVL